MIPRHTKTAIDHYVDEGIPTAGFLRAVLINDLFDAVARADNCNRQLLAGICEYIYNYTPTACHGSEKRVIDWLKFHSASPIQARDAAGADREKRVQYREVL